MFNHQRRPTLPRPTAAPAATQLRVVLTRHLLPQQETEGRTQPFPSTGSGARVSAPAAAEDAAAGGTVSPDDEEEDGATLAFGDETGDAYGDAMRYGVCTTGVCTT